MLSDPSPAKAETMTVSKECALCHRIGSKAFVTYGVEQWRCSRDDLCRTRAILRTAPEDRIPTSATPPLEVSHAGRPDDVMEPRASADPRALRTSMVMTSVLFDLLTETALSDITISSLCEAAGVHRTTFYGHYADIYAFAADTFRHQLDELFASDFLAAADQVGAVSVNFYAVEIDRMLAHIRARRPAYRTMFGTSPDAGFRRDLQTRLAHQVVALSAGQIDAPVTVSFLAGGSLGVLEAWANSDSPDLAIHASVMVDAFNRHLPALQR